MMAAAEYCFSPGAALYLMACVFAAGCVVGFFVKSLDKRIGDEDDRD